MSWDSRRQRLPLAEGNRRFESGGQDHSKRDLNSNIRKPNTAPTAFDPQAATLLSPHLHFGSLSVREFYWRVQDVVDNYSGEASQLPVSLTGQVLFRDMYSPAKPHSGTHSGKQSTTPTAASYPETSLAKSTIAPNSSQANTTSTLHKQKNSSSGGNMGEQAFPRINALMPQLRQEGWIHHLRRHAVACFLTRGGSYVSWERGAEVFEE
jgi:cryptochrome